MTGYTDYWFGLTRAVNYTAPPTLSNGTTLDQSELADIRSGILECGQLASKPNAPFPMSLDTEGEYQQSDGEQTVWRGYMYYAHHQLRWRIEGGNDDGEICRARIYVNSTALAIDGATTYYDFTSLTETVEDVADMTGLSLTRGTGYEVKVTMEANGTASTITMHADVWHLSQESDDTNPTLELWEHGDTDVDAIKLDKYGEMIDKINPGSGSNDAPIFYEQPVVNSQPNEFYIKHTRRYLHWSSSGGTSEIFFGANFASRVSLSGSSGVKDLLEISDLAWGQYYYVDDCEYALEYDA